MKKVFCALFTTLALLLAACSSVLPSSVTNPDGSHKPAAKKNNKKACGLSLEEVAKDALEKAPYKSAETSWTQIPWAWQEDGVNTSVYDPCAPLSVISIPVSGATADSPEIQLLYSYGEYLYPATKWLFGGAPAIQRISPEEVEVSYRFMKPGDLAPVESTGWAESKFKYDVDQDEVVRTGELPINRIELEDPGIESSGKPAYKDEGRAPGIPAEAYEGAGGPIPEGAKEIPITGVSIQGGETFRSIQTPDKNIGCEFPASGEGLAYCGVMSYLKENKYPEEMGGSFSDGYSTIPAWAFSLNSDKAISAHPETSAPAFFDDRSKHTIIQPGEVMYTGNYVCASSGSALTCWNTSTGHGVYMTPEGYQGW